MNVAVAAIQSDSWKPMGDLVIPILRSYCQKHNYHLAIHHFHGAYEFVKIRMIIDLLKEGYDLIFCLDLDTLITNHNIKVEDFVDPDHDFYITKDINTWNAGSVIVKNTEWSLGFMRYILQTEGLIENEQTAIMHRNPDHMPLVKVLPHPSINSYPYHEYAPTWGLIEGWEPTTGSKEKPTHEQGDWQKGDFIAHVPGLAMSHRLEVLSRLKEHILL